MYSLNDDLENMRFCPVLLLLYVIDACMGIIMLDVGYTTMLCLYIKCIICRSRTYTHMRNDTYIFGVLFMLWMNGV